MANWRQTGLEIDEDMRQQKAEWVLQRIAWIIFYGLIIAIMLGLLGSGPLSHASAGSADGPIQMQYERFLRHRTSDTLHFILQPESETVSLLVDRQYLKQAALTDINPQPLKLISGGDAMTFVFAADSGKPVHVGMKIQPEKLGTIEGWVAVEGHPRHAFKQFVYP